MNLLDQHCAPCGTIPPLTPEIAHEYLAQIPEWTIDSESKMIRRSWKFKDFAGALAFANEIGTLAEKEGHHPDLYVSWGKVTVELETHSIGGLTMNDFILAAHISALAGGE